LQTDHGEQAGRRVRLFFAELKKKIYFVVFLWQAVAEVTDENVDSGGRRQEFVERLAGANPGEVFGWRLVTGGIMMSHARVGLFTACGSSSK